MENLAPQTTIFTPIPTILRHRAPPLSAIRRLIDAGAHPLMARLFAARGVSGPHELSTAPDGLLSPHTMLHLASAAYFLADAIAAQKSILVIADYDCDGATACAVALRGLRSMGARAEFLVPNRFIHGYGLTPEIVQLAVSRHAPDVIITVDNGISSIDGVAEASHHGIEVIITDHHLPGPMLPAARAIVNPNQPGCGFASKHLCGVGVAFYLMLGLRAELRSRGAFANMLQPRLDGLLDLVALGTVADVVKLDANNRILVAQGLRRIRSGAMQPGIAALFASAGADPRAASPDDLGFRIGPRLNAAGRLEDMSLGIRCLVTEDLAEAATIARQLNAINLERRAIEADMQDAALLQLDTVRPDGRASICVVDPAWHQGVSGIVASRLKERFARPAIVFAPGTDGTLRGSGRSVPCLHLRDALDSVYTQFPGLILKFGGHAMAAGLTIGADAFAKFAAAFDNVAASVLGEAAPGRVVEHDGALEAGHFSIETANMISQGVWGQGFPAPIFCDQFKVTKQKLLKGKHLKLALKRDGRCFDAIWFGRTEPLGDTATVAYRLDTNLYRGQTSLQLVVEHAEPA